MEDRKAELRNELDKAMKAPKTRKSEYHTRVKNIEDKIKRKEEQLLHVDDKPILRVDILMTDEYLNTICYNEDHLKSYVKAIRFLPVKVKIVRVLWYLKNGKADFRKSLKIDNDDYVPFSIPMITGENVTCKVNLRCFYEASDIEKVMKKMLMIYEGKVEPIDSIDFDIVANEDEDYETPEEMKERKIEEERKKREALQ